ncbi:MAG TPA: AAA family ATPase [Candidatus Binataceae bacterium]|nr:AAA family ATPase [Candidatus Binataceae bacterium]
MSWGQGKDRSDGLRLLVLGDDGEARQELCGTLAQSNLQLSQEQGALSGAPARDAGESDAILVLAGEQASAVLEFLQRQGGVSSKPSVVVITPESEPGAIRRLLRAGADEILFIPPSLPDLVKTLLKVSERLQRVDQPKLGLTCAIAGINGGVGVTTVAANLGLALRYALGVKVALVDLDLQTADLAVQLNLEAEHSVAGAVEIEKLDSIALESQLIRHPSGAYLLAGPKQIEEGEKVGASALAQLLDLMRRMFDYLIIDCGPHLDDRTLAAWEQSDHLFVVVNQSVSAVRGSWRIIDLHNRLRTAAPAPQLILNKANNRSLVSAARVSDTLGRPLFASLVRDDRLLEEVASRGLDLWRYRARAPLTRGFEALADKISGRERKTGWLRWPARTRSPNLALAEVKP